MDGATSSIDIHWIDWASGGIERIILANAPKTGKIALGAYAD